MIEYGREVQLIWFNIIIMDLNFEQILIHCQIKKEADC